MKEDFDLDYDFLLARADAEQELIIVYDRTYTAWETSQRTAMLRLAAAFAAASGMSDEKTRAAMGIDSEGAEVAVVRGNKPHHRTLHAAALVAFGLASFGFIVATVSLAVAFFTP